MSFVGELKRRNVFRVAVAYLAGSWLLIEVADTLFTGFGIPDWAFRFVVIVLALGLIPTLVVSWAYEITPDGLRREKDLVRDESLNLVTTKRLDMLTIGLVVVALVFIVLDRFWLNARTASEPDVVAESESTVEPAVDRPAATASDTDELPNSIAVLPFANRSADPNDAFFVDGIHDDLLTYIARTGGLKTISRTSVMQYRDSEKPIPQIASELGVSAILEGGVQRAGDHVRINVQLIDARTDDHLWGEIYDRQLTASNIFSIQSEIAGMIAEALRSNLTPAGWQAADRAPTENLAALEAYYLGRQQTEKRFGPALEAAVGHFSAAIELDADFALAYVGLADTYRLQSNYVGVPRSETEPKIEATVERALQLDPLLGEAYASLANLRVWRGDAQGAEEAFQRAIELNPNYAPAYQWYGEWLAGQVGRVDEALELSRKSVELDPLSPIMRVDYAESFESAGRLDDALTQYLKAIEINPEFIVGHRQLAYLYWGHLGQLDEAATHLIKVDAIDSSRAAGFLLALIFWDLGDEQKADRWFNRALAADDDSWFAMSVSAMVAIYRRDQAAAAEFAGKVLDQQPRDAYSQRILRDHDLGANKPAAARDRYAAAFPELFNEGGPDVQLGNVPAAVDLTHVLMSLGESDKAEQLLSGVESLIASDRSLAGALRKSVVTRIHLLRGDKEGALAELRDVIDAGWREDWRFFLEFDPVLDPIRDDPRFHDMLEDIRSDMAGQLARFEASEALDN